MLEVMGILAALVIWALPMAEEAADDRAWRKGSALAFGAALVLSCLI
jgi:hypothetical protein